MEAVQIFTLAESSKLSSLWRNREEEETARTHVCVRKGHAQDRLCTKSRKFTARSGKNENQKYDKKDRLLSDRLFTSKATDFLNMFLIL